MSTYLQMKTELSDRGFDTLTAARRGDIINAAVNEVDLSYPWPYRENSGTGTAPLSVPTLGEIEAVTDETDDVRLEVVSYSNLLDWAGDLSETGTPEYAYVSYPAGVPTVNVWRVTTHTIGCQFWRTPTALSADGDLPLAPTRWHFVYLATASRMAAAETGGDVATWTAEAERGLQAMLLGLLPDYLSGQHQRVSFDSACDW